MLKIPFVSVIAPAFNEESILPEFSRRTVQVLESLADRYEIIIVDDGSNDTSRSILEKLHQANPSIKFISFSRNFGHAAAISAGLDYAEGDAVVILDADLQDPPEVFPEFFREWKAGYQVVYGIRKKRKEGMLKRIAYFSFYRIFRSLAMLNNVAMDSGDFALLDRQVVLQLRKLPERSRFLRGLRSWVGYKQKGVPYERASRFAGSTKFPFSKLIRLALDGFFSFSYIPLRLATFLGLFVALVSVIGIAVLLYFRITTGVIGLPGFSSTMIAILFIGAVQLVCLGILGEYIGRIYDEVRHRPLYIIKEQIGFADHHGHTRS